MLDFEALQKTSEETYRQYFERLLQHTRQHLAPAEAKVENFKIEVKDKMTAVDILSDSEQDSE